MGVRFMLFSVISLFLISKCSADDILGCGGFIKSHVPLDYSKIEIGLYTKGGILKEKTECAPTNGYFFLPVYEKGEYMLKVHPPPGWSFEPSEKELVVDGVADACSLGQDVNFSFNGFGITGQVITAGQTQGPAGIAVQLINDEGIVRNTITTVGGHFSFTPVIPGKYTVKASHPKWQLNPAEAVVVVKEGNTALPTGVLSVKGYDVKGTVTGFGQPSPGVYVMLFSNELKQKLKVEGCNTALLQGVKDAPICHSITNAAGEFTFGLVPAGSYRLAVLSATPGHTAQTYNVKPDQLPISVTHSSLFIKNAFEITGFNVAGWTLADEENGIGQVRVVVEEVAVAWSDSRGAFTLPALQPGVYTLTATHDECSFEPSTLKVGWGGAGEAAVVRAGAWLVCGRLEPPPEPPRAVLLRAAAGGELRAAVEAGGAWCVRAPPGEYAARVEEGARDDPLQYFPARLPVRVRGGPVRDLRFSQLRATVRGQVRCLPGDACDVLVELSAPAHPALPARTATARDGEYVFADVRPGAVAARVAAARRCWQAERHEALLQHSELRLPAFLQTAYALTVHSDYDLEVQYASATHSGSAVIARGESRLCLPSTERYTLTPLGCHQHQPASYSVHLQDPHPTVKLKAVAHANTIVVIAPLEVDDLKLTIHMRGGSEEVGPLAVTSRDHGEVRYEHVVYLAEGEACVVEARSRALVAGGAHTLRGGGACAHPALTLRAAAGRRVLGRTSPPVAGVRVTLRAGDLTLTQTTGSDGAYEFGPIDASKPFSVTAEKESYVFGERDEEGTIAANKLGAIHVKLVEERDGSRLQGALVSASGGEFRRTLAAAEGAVSFSSLPADRYYVKPLYNEYKFEPPHATLHLPPGADHHLTFKGVRVAWSWSGRLVSAGGAGWQGAALQAAPAPAAAAPAPAAPSVPAPAACTPLHATTDHLGAFRIRGLLPQCRYALSLKPGAERELPGLRLVQAPPYIEVKDRRDVTDVVLIAMQPQQLTDSSVLVVAHVDHYKTLRLALSLESSPTTHIYSSKLDSAPLNHLVNPGLMYTLPRLPADNNTYVVRMESTLSKASHSYEEQTFYFTSDGHYKHVTFKFTPKVKSSDQELKHTSIGAVPLIVAAAVAYWQRGRITATL